MRSLLRALLVTTTLATCARADTVFFDNTASPIVSASYIASFVSQNVRIKTSGFTPGDQLASADIWLTQFLAPDGSLPFLNVYADNGGTIGSLLASAQLSSGLAYSYDPQHVQVDFTNGPALEDDTFYWLGMSFATGATGSLGWSTSLDSQMTFLGFITPNGTNYVGTFNVPHAKLVGTSAAVPEGGSVAMYLAVLLAGLAVHRHLRLGAASAAA